MPVIERRPQTDHTGAALFRACAASAYMPLWSVPFDLPVGQYGEGASTPVLRELDDGCLRLAYQRDAAELVADCYSPYGRLISRVRFPLPDIKKRRCFHAPIFVSDHLIYWIGVDYSDSLLMDLETASISRLPMPASPPVRENTYFEVACTLLLENGDLVLAGGDIQPARYYRPSLARVVIIDRDGNVVSTVVELNDTSQVDAHVDNGPFSALMPVRGSAAYIVQRSQRHVDGSENLLTYRGEKHRLQAYPELNDRKILFADVRGIWLDELGLGLITRGITSEFCWMLPGVSLHEVKPTSDGHCLALDYEEGQYRLLKISPYGVVQWSVDVTPGVGYKTVSFSERKGRILVSQCSHHTDATFFTDESQSPPVVMAAGNKRARVQHRLLGLDGREIARFSEPEYDAVLIRHPERPEEYCGVREFRAGSCLSLGATLLRNGSFVTLSDWCSRQPQSDPEARMFYFGLV